MQRQMAATVEEQMMVKAIREESSWEALPKRIQVAAVTKEDWNRRYSCMLPQSIDMIPLLVLDNRFLVTRPG
jgi:hypothetical protein